MLTDRVKGRRRSAFSFFYTYSSDSPLTEPDEPLAAEPIEIPLEHLSPEVLQAVIEEYITREGTDYGQQEYSLEQKVGQIRTGLASGRVMIVYDPLTESCTLLHSEQRAAK